MSIILPDARHLSDDSLETLRLRALHGLELGYSEVDLAQLLGVRRETISRWHTAYHTEGLDALPGERTGRPLGSGRMLSEAQAQTIRDQIDYYSPQQVGLKHALWTRQAVADLIRRDLGIELALRTVGKYLQRWGYTSKKPARKSRRQDPDEVEQWLQDTYPAIEAQAERENAEILWADEVGAQADHHPGSGYARRGERATMEVPQPHLRVNQISAISNEGTVRFMTYKGSFTAEVFLQFLTLLISGATRKIVLIVDQLGSHTKAEVQAWVEARPEQIELHYLPTYSPELNPVEYLNNDMKGNINKAGLPPDKPTLQERLLGFMRKLSGMPRHVMSYFLHPQTLYAAPVELG